MPLCSITQFWPKLAGSFCDADHENGMYAMDDEVITQTKADREILSFDVSDELLERAANVEKSGFTLAYCTSYWDSCGLPSVAR